MLPAIFTDHVRTVTVLTGSALYYNTHCSCPAVAEPARMTTQPTPAGLETIWNKDQAKSDSFLI